MAGYGTHYCRPSWPQTSGHPSASASAFLVLGRWGCDSEFSGTLPEAPQTLREERMHERMVTRDPAAFVHGDRRRQPPGFGEKVLL